MHRILAIAALALAAACGATPESADPASDAPDGRVPLVIAVKPAASYVEALRTWRSAEDMNAWIAATFEYDMARA